MTVLNNKERWWGPRIMIERFCNIKVLELHTSETPLYMLQRFINLQRLHIIGGKITGISNSAACHDFIKKSKNHKNDLKYLKVSREPCITAFRVCVFF